VAPAEESFQTKPNRHIPELHQLAIATKYVPIDMNIRLNKKMQPSRQLCSTVYLNRWRFDFCSFHRAMLMLFVSRSPNTGDLSVEKHPQNFCQNGVE